MKALFAPKPVLPKYRTDSLFAPLFCYIRTHQDNLLVQQLTRSGCEVLCAYCSVLGFDLVEKVRDHPNIEILPPSPSSLVSVFSAELVSLFGKSAAKILKDLNLMLSDFDNKAQVLTDIRLHVLIRILEAYCREKKISRQQNLERLYNQYLPRPLPEEAEKSELLLGS